MDNPNPVPPILRLRPLSTRAAGFAGACRVYPVEALEYAIDMFFRDTHSIIGEAKVIIFRIFFIAVDGNPYVFSRISDRVVI